MKTFFCAAVLILFQLSSFHLNDNVKSQKKIIFELFENNNITYFKLKPLLLPQSTFITSIEAYILPDDRNVFIHHMILAMEDDSVWKSKFIVGMGTDSWNDDESKFIYQLPHGYGIFIEQPLLLNAHLISLEPTKMKTLHIDFKICSNVSQQASVLTTDSPGLYYYNPAEYHSLWPSDSRSIPINHSLNMFWTRGKFVSSGSLIYVQSHTHRLADKGVYILNNHSGKRKMYSISEFTKKEKDNIMCAETVSQYGVLYGKNTKMKCKPWKFQRQEYFSVVCFSQIPTFIQDEYIGYHCNIVFTYRCMDIKCPISMIATD